MLVETSKKCMFGDLNLNVLRWNAAPAEDLEQSFRIIISQKFGGCCVDRDSPELEADVEPGSYVTCDL